MPEAPILTIIERVRQGDLEAYSEIIRLYEPDIRRVVACATYDRLRSAWVGPPPKDGDAPVTAYFADAEDLVQESFINAYLHLDQFDVRRDFGAWLRTIARNVVRKERRRSWREAFRLKTYYHYLAAMDPSPDFDEQDAAQLNRELDDCRKELTAVSEQALTWRYAEGLDFSEIAARLDRTLAATRQLLARVRSALRHCVEQRRSRHA